MISLEKEQHPQDSYINNLKLPKEKSMNGIILVEYLIWMIMSM